MAGKWFSIGMIISSLISIPVAWMPGHRNMFLFLIALFTIYLVLAGNRALTFKPIFKKASPTFIDKLISGSMLLFALMMIGIGILGLLQTGQNAVLFLFFGLFGLGFAIKDFQFYKNPNANKSNWLVNHLGRIIGAYIASITAFMVAGLHFDNLAAWMLPSFIGSGAIIYWTRRVGKRSVLRPKLPKDNNLA